MDELNYRINSQSPGFPVFTGIKKTDTTKIRIFEYDEKNVKEVELSGVDELVNYKTEHKVVWYNITGLHDTSVIEKIGKNFSIHPLIIEDIVNVNHSPKIENYEEALFSIVKMIDQNAIKGLNIEQVCFYLDKNYLITFQEDEKDVFDIIRDRIRKNIGRIRTLGADYLMYRLMDAIVDNYLVVLENYNDRLDILDDKIMIHPDQVAISSIHSLRKDIMKFRRAVFPLREVIYGMEKEKDRLIKKNTIYFLRDLGDHLKHVLDSIDTYHEMTNNLIEIYLSNSSYKMNEVMKVLTIISTIFIPLTFIVGVYGMNFDVSAGPLNMPELTWKFGYPVVMVVMLVIAVLLILWFKKKKWM